MFKEKIKILVVEDELKIREVITHYLVSENYEVVTAEDGLDALKAFEMHEDIHLMLVDVMMPQMDGFTLCREVKKIRPVPVIFLTARGEEYERLMGFDLGADDYIVKPFSLREVTARIKAVLKRSALSESGNFLSIGDLVVDIAGRTAKIGIQEILFTPKEFDLLVYLMENQGKVLTRRQITENVWDWEYFGDQRTVDTHIKKLREKLGGLGEKYIKTVWGVGYKFL